MTPHPIKEVVLCADDYAFNAPVSQGIVALAVLGRLSATSVMSLSPRWAEDVVALRDVRERLDVGVHLDWTSSFAFEAGHGSGGTEVRLRSALRLYKQKTSKIRLNVSWTPLKRSGKPRLITSIAISMCINWPFFVMHCLMFW